MSTLLNGHEATLAQAVGPHTALLRASSHGGGCEKRKGFPTGDARAAWDRLQEWPGGVGGPGGPGRGGQMVWTCGPGRAVPNVSSRWGSRGQTGWSSQDVDDSVAVRACRRGSGCRIHGHSGPWDLGVTRASAA